MKHTLIATAVLICLAAPAFADSESKAKADAIRECVLAKVGGHEAFGKAASPIPHQPRTRPDGMVDLGYGARRPQPFISTQAPTVNRQELERAAFICRRDNP